MQCSVIPQCKKEGKNSFEIYSETLGKTVIIMLCDEHLAIYKKAGVNPKFHNHPEIKWKKEENNSAKLALAKSEIIEEKENKKCMIQ